MAAVVRVFLLGTTRLTVDRREVALGGRRQAAVLTHLALRAPEMLPTEALIEAVWADASPPTARKTLQKYISALRAAMGRTAAVLVTSGPGYALAVDPDAVDAVRFSRLVSQGVNARRTGQPERAARLLAEARGMWHGAPLLTVADSPHVVGDIRRLRELALQAVEEQVEVRIELGADAELVPELEDLIVRYPFRERFWAALMLALYRTGRQVESLRAYHRLRTTLVDEIGVEPSAELTALHARVLEHHPDLVRRR